MKKVKGLTNRIVAMLMSGMLVVGAVPGTVLASESQADIGQTSEIAAEVPEGTNAEDFSEEAYSEDAPAQEEAAEAQYYTVTLDANGGYFENEWDDALGETVEQAEVVEKHIPVGGSIAAVPVFIEMDQDGPSRVFAGWSLERDGEQVSQAEEEYIPLDNCVLYAIWDAEDTSVGDTKSQEVEYDDENVDQAEAAQKSEDIEMENANSDMEEKSEGDSSPESMENELAEEAGNNVTEEKNVKDDNVSAANADSETKETEGKTLKKHTSDQEKEDFDNQYSEGDLEDNYIVENEELEEVPSLANETVENNDVKQLAFDSYNNFLLRSGWVIVETPSGTFNSATGFFLRDITGNGIPELIVRYGTVIDGSIQIYSYDCSLKEIKKLSNISEEIYCNDEKRYTIVYCPEPRFGISEWYEIHSYDGELVGYYQLSSYYGCYQYDDVITHTTSDISEETYNFEVNNLLSNSYVLNASDAIYENTEEVRNQIFKEGNIDPGGETIVTPDPASFALSIGTPDNNAVVIGEDGMLSALAWYDFNDQDTALEEAQQINWTCSDPSAVEIYDPVYDLETKDVRISLGLRGKKPGAYTITGTAPDGRTASADVVVEPKIVAASNNTTLTETTDVVMVQTTLNTGDKAYLTSFLNGITGEIKDDYGTIGGADSKRVEVSEDGKTGKLIYTLTPVYGGSCEFTLISPGGQKVVVKIYSDKEYYPGPIYEENTVVYYNENQKKKVHFDYSLDECLSHSSSEYNPQLAHILMALAASAYQDQNAFSLLNSSDGVFPSNPLAITESLRNLGFSTEDGNIIEKNYYIDAFDPSYQENSTAFSIAKKTNSEGETIVAVIIRGSYGGFGDDGNFHLNWNRWASDWRGNTNFWNYGTGLHEGFDIAASEIVDEISSFLRQKNLDKSTVKYVVTGHSRGAAVANLVSKKLIDSGVSKEKVYDYNFACPDSGRDYDGQWNKNNEYGSIFNINNVKDIVGVIPGNIFNSSLNLNTFFSKLFHYDSNFGILFWGKYGTTYFFAENWDTVSDTIMGNPGVEHQPTYYLEYLSQKPSADSFMSWTEARVKLIENGIHESFTQFGKTVGIFCPVDVTITDKNGEIVAEVKNGSQRYYNDSFGDIIILTADDQCLIYLREDYYTITLTGTDNGTLSYFVSDIMEEENVGGLTFDNVDLISGKTIENVLDPSIPLEESKLLVLDQEGNPIRIISESGEESEIDDETDGSLLPSGCYITSVPISSEANINGIEIELDKGSYAIQEGDILTIDAIIKTDKERVEGQNEYIGYFAYYANKQWNQLASWDIEGGTTKYKLKLKKDSWETNGDVMFTVSVFPKDSFTQGAALKDNVFLVNITPNQYSVKFDANGGFIHSEIDDVSGLEVTNEETVNKHITQGGYVFIPSRHVQNEDDSLLLFGWSTTPDGDPVIGFNESYQPDGDCTLYAVWKRGKPAGTRSYGEFNDNGSLDLGDILKVKRHIQAFSDSTVRADHPDWILTGYDYEAADINHDTVIDDTDAGLIQQSIAAQNSEDVQAEHPDWILSETFEVFSFDDASGSVTGITLNKKSIVLEEGKEITLSAEVIPSDAVDRSIEWSSSNTDIVTVDNTGKVKGISEGKATITASSCDGSGVSATCEVTVNRSLISITDATVTGIASKTYNGTALTQNPIVKVDDKTLTDRTDYILTYANNTDAGTATVTITGKGKYTGTRTETFTINKAAQAITAKAAASSVSVGKTTTVSIAGNKGNKSYKSSNTAIATVTSAGKVTARKVGTVKITATSAATDNYNAASKTVTIKVVPAATTSLTAANQVTGIKLTWKKVAGANGYLIYRGSTLIKTITNGNTVSYVDKKANTNGTRYVYKVVAKAATGTSRLSKSVAFFRVARPVISSLKNVSSKKMKVKWGKNAKATGYKILYSRSKTFVSGNKSVTFAGASNVSKVIGKLTKRKTYYVSVRAYKIVGGKVYWSEWSAVKGVKIRK